MGVVSRWKELTLAAVAARSEVVQTAWQDIYKSLCALYETLWDATPAGASSQVYQGHDHTPTFGGAPITRGLIWSEVSADTPLYTVTFDEANQTRSLTTGATANKTRSQGGVWRSFVSPGLSRLGSLTGWICYEAQNSSFVLKMATGGAEIELPETTAELPQWIEVRAPIEPGTWQRFDPTISCGNYDEEKGTSVKIYALQLEEEAAARVGVPGIPIRLPVAAASGVVPVGHMALEQDLVADEEWLDSDAILRGVAMLNALYEGTEALASIGASSQSVKGHDHGSYGGRAVARNVVVSAGNGNNGLFTCPIPSASTWIIADGNGAGSRSDAGIPMFVGYVSPGLSSSGNPPTTAPYLTAWVYIYENQSDTSTVDLRIYNSTTGTLSAVTTLGAGTVKRGWFPIDKVPCDGDAWNDFDLEVRSDKVGVTGDHTIRIHALIIAECAGLGAVGVSSGSEVLGGTS
jgi:hypothetical protein